MKGKTVYIVTSPQLGWDCVCGVFETEEDAIERYGQENFDDGEYILSDTTIS